MNLNHLPTANSVPRITSHSNSNIRMPPSPSGSSSIGGVVEQQQHHKHSNDDNDDNKEKNRYALVEFRQCLVNHSNSSSSSGAMKTNNSTTPTARLQHQPEAAAAASGTKAMYRSNSNNSSNSPRIANKMMRRRKSESCMIDVTTNNKRTSDSAGRPLRRRNSQDMLISKQYSIREISEKDGDAKPDKPQARSRTPSLRTSASERIKLRQMLLGDGDTGQEESSSHAAGINDSRLGEQWGQKQQASGSLGSAISDRSLGLSSSLQSNEEWPEFKEGSNNSHSNRDTFRTSNNGSHKNPNNTIMNNDDELNINSTKVLHDEDFRFNNNHRRASMPNMGRLETHQEQRTQNSSITSLNSTGNSSVMADYIALKLRVAELQSDLQVAQSQAKKYTSGLELAQDKMVQFQVQAGLLCKRNEQLEQENAFFLKLIGNLERLGRLDGLEDMLPNFVSNSVLEDALLVEQQQGNSNNGGGGLMTTIADRGFLGKTTVPLPSNTNKSWKKPELDWGTVHDSDRSGLTAAAAEDASNIKHKRIASADNAGSSDKLGRTASWWNRNRDLQPDTNTVSNTSNDVVSGSNGGTFESWMPTKAPRHRTRSLSFGGAWSAARRLSSASPDTSSSHKDEQQQNQPQQQQRIASLVETIKKIPRTLSVTKMSEEEEQGLKNSNVQGEEHQHQLRRRPRQECRRQQQGQKPQEQGGDGGTTLAAVPKYVQVLDNDDYLRCSDISFDVPFKQLRRGEDIADYGNRDYKNAPPDNLSGIDEQESHHHNTAPLSPEVTARSPRENDERKQHANSEITKHSGSEAESFLLWQSSGPLGYSMTECQSMVLLPPSTKKTRLGMQDQVGTRSPNNKERPTGDRSSDEFRQSSEDEHWTPSEFEYSSVGT